MPQEMPFGPEIMPMVVERDGRVERVYDIFSRLLKERIVFIGNPITDFTANVVVAQLLHLESEDSVKPVQIYLNTPGGLVTAGLAIYDAMQLLKCPVHIICIGQAASMGAVLLAGGEKGSRCALENSRILIHQILGGTSGQASDVEIHAREMLRLKDKLNEILAKHTGKTIEQIAKDTDRDFFMTAEEAVKYGLIDKVLTKKPW